jgi:glyoxylase-like metal-dependent hydrolase (beta-lactamase superfamily II)
MGVAIYPISFGVSRAYLLQGEKCVLVDAGIPGQRKAFLRGMERTGIRPREIALVIITHGHLDHIGLVNFIAGRTGAQIAIHHQDRKFLETGKHPTPPGTTLWGKVLSFLGRGMTNISVEPAEADILLGDDDFDLGAYGIPGRVLHTPGHTLGSVTVLLESGEAFVGDLAMSARIMRMKPGPPIFAEDIKMVMQSWKKLRESGVRKIYPAHGRPFPIEVLDEEFS